MSTDANEPGDRETRAIEITLSLEESGDLWVARDEATGVVSQGETREDALANLDEALEGYHGEGEPPSDEDLRDLGIDPEHNTSGSLDDSDVFE